MVREDEFNARQKKLAKSLESIKHVSNHKKSFKSSDPATVKWDSQSKERRYSFGDGGTVKADTYDAFFKRRQATRKVNAERNRADEHRRDMAVNAAEIRETKRIEREQRTRRLANAAIDRITSRRNVVSTYDLVDTEEMEFLLEWQAGDRPKIGSYDTPSTRKYWGDAKEIDLVPIITYNFKWDSGNEMTRGIERHAGGWLFLYESTTRRGSLSSRHAMKMPKVNLSNPIVRAAAEQQMYVAVESLAGTVGHDLETQAYSTIMWWRGISAFMFRVKPITRRVIEMSKTESFLSFVPRDTGSLRDALKSKIRYNDRSKKIFGGADVKHARIVNNYKKRYITLRHSDRDPSARFNYWKLYVEKIYKTLLKELERELYDIMQSYSSDSIIRDAYKFTRSVAKKTVMWIVEPQINKMILNP